MDIAECRQRYICYLNGMDTRTDLIKIFLSWESWHIKCIFYACKINILDFNKLIPISNKLAKPMTYRILIILVSLYIFHFWHSAQYNESCYQCGFNAVSIVMVMSMNFMSFKHQNCKAHSSLRSNWNKPNYMILKQQLHAKVR